MSAVTTRDALAKALREHGDVNATCGHRIYGPCSDCLADRLIASGVVIDVAALADDEDLLRAWARAEYGDLRSDEVASVATRILLRPLAQTLAAAITERAR